jgi:hypothetical protein
MSLFIGLSLDVATQLRGELKSSLERPTTWGTQTGGKVVPHATERPFPKISNSGRDFVATGSYSFTDNQWLLSI